MITYCISLNFSYQQLDTIVPGGRQNTRGKIADVDSVAQNQSLHVTGYGLRTRELEHPDSLCVSKLGLC